MIVFLRLLTALLVGLAIPGAGVLPATAAAIQAKCALAETQPMDCCTGMACCQMNSSSKDAAPMPVTAPTASADLKFIPIALKVVALLAVPQNREDVSTHPVADSLTPHAPPPLVRSGIFLI
ncbi:MAG TPA: hypothetical protein VIT21_08725 [Chthoniobacterales bacterium]